MIEMQAPRHRIREARLAAGLSQNALAAKLGWDRQQVWQLESRVVEPRWSTLRAVADALGVTIADLMVDVNTRTAS